LTIDLLENYCIVSSSDNHSFAAMIFPSRSPGFCRGTQNFIHEMEITTGGRSSFLAMQQIAINERRMGEVEEICVW
jgi:hypothetical protein